MDLNYLRKLVKIFDDSTADEIRIEEEGIKLKLSKVGGQIYSSAAPLVQIPAPQPVSVQGNSENPSAIDSESVKPDKKDDDTIGGHVVKSPIVGTFYRAPSPDSEVYVEVGSHITKGSTLCIVEAMKLMNEIESDVTGTVTKILIENAQPVEYGQPIFVVKPD